VQLFPFAQPKNFSPALPRRLVEMFDAEVDGLRGAR
jgi:hypothetical protein